MTGRLRATVLVLEDDEQVSRLICDHLVEAGYDVLLASDGLEAISIADHHDGPIGVAILDIVTPRGSGLDVGNEITLKRPATRILYISGLIDSVAVRCIVTGNPESLLAKPFTKEQLLQTIARLLSS